MLKFFLKFLYKKKKGEKTKGVTFKLFSVSYVEFMIISCILYVFLIYIVI